VTLIDRQYDHVFELLFYQVACGSLSPDEIAALLPSILSRRTNDRLLRGDVQDANHVSKWVPIADKAIFEHDSLIVVADPG
jgi:NADH dehydrogenase FAD-containing subunit